MWISTVPAPASMSWIARVNCSRMILWRPSIQLSFSSTIGVLQTGQLFARWNHLSMQRRWNECVQSRVSLVLRIASWHIEHSGNSESGRWWIQSWWVPGLVRHPGCVQLILILSYKRIMSIIKHLVTQDAWKFFYWRRRIRFNPPAL